MIRLVTPLLFGLSCVLAAQGYTQDDLHFRYWQEVGTADRDFSRAATERGRTQAFLDVLGNGSVLFREGPVDARDLYERNQQIYSLDQLSWRQHFIDVSRDGDLGITVGPNMFTAIQPGQDDEGGQQAYSYLVNVWHKLDGQWRLMVDMVVRVPGFLSMDVEPDYRDTLLVMAETAHPVMVLNNDLQGLFDADRLFGTSINFRGGQRALLRWGLEHQRVYLPGMAPGVGAEQGSLAYGKYIDSRVTAASPLALSTMGGYIANSREMGYTYGVMTTSSAMESSEFRANYLRVWRFTDANEWRVAMEFLSPY